MAAFLISLTILESKLWESSLFLNEVHLITESSQKLTKFLNGSTDVVL